MQNFEGLCIRVNKHKKTYYVHWSIPKYKDGKFIRVGKKKWLCDFHIPLAEVKEDFKTTSEYDINFTLRVQQNTPITNEY